MSTVEDLREQATERRRWLDRALAVLQNDSAVVAVWLWGSGGRGVDDGLSDWDIFVALASASDLAELDPAAWARRFGELLWWHEDPYNAPTEGRYLAVAYPAPYAALPVDWYLQPASAVQIGRDTRVLLERRSLRRAGVDTFALFPAVANAEEFVLPSDPVQRVQHHLDWFWFMFAPMAKWAARGHRQRARDQLEGLTRVAREAGALVGRGPAVTDEGTDVFDTIRALGQAMRDLHPALLAAGIDPPSAGERLATFDEANEIRRRGWLGQPVGAPVDRGGPGASVPGGVESGGVGDESQP